MSIWIAEHLTSLNALHAKCASAQVSYAIVWNEHDDTYYVSIDSVAPSERFVSRNYSRLPMCIDVALIHLENL